MRWQNSLKIGALVILFTLLVSENYWFGYAEEGVAVPDQDIDAIIQNFESYQKQIESQWQNKTTYTKEQVNRTRDALRKNYQVFSESSQKIKEYEKALQPITEKIATLQGALNLLDQQLDFTKLKIKNVTIQIVEKEEEIYLTMYDISQLEAETEEQKRVVLEYIKLLYDQEKNYYDFDEKTISDFKMFLLDDSLAKVIQSTAYTKIVEKTGRDILSKLVAVQDQLDAKKKEMEASQSVLTELKQKLEGEQRTLEDQESAKKQLLEETKGEEKKYTDLLNISRVEMEASASDITMLESHLNSLQNQLSSLEDNSDGTNVGVGDAKTRSEVRKVYNLTKDNPTPAAMLWPVAPNRGLSAYFNDPSYRAVFGVDHHAIDIPTGQGTKIKAPLDGIVYKVKDNGMGYSYLILAHAGGLRTVYGHIPEFLVKEGDLVRAGDVIALSGGTPGTKGAGWMTTGAHLHFEVWSQGKPVDPLTYVDRSVLP